VGSISFSDVRKWCHPYFKSQVDFVVLACVHRLEL